jgi:ribosomal protein L7/L12
MYKKAIDILTGDVAVDYKKIAIRLAKEDPACFCAYFADSQVSEYRLPDGVKSEDQEAYVLAVRLLKEGNAPIPCIKELSSNFSFRLKEAKDLVDLARSATGLHPPHSR